MAKRLEEAAQYLTTTIGYFNLKNEMAQARLPSQNHAAEEPEEEQKAKWQGSERALAPA